MPSHDTLRCFIVGTTSLTIQCTDILLARGHAILGIISTDPDVIRWAKQQALPHLSPQNDLVDALSQHSFDYLFSIVNETVLPNAVLNLPLKGCINYHDSPLPRYAGVYATSWAIFNGETRHAISWHQMVEEVDAGALLKQESFEIMPHETALTLNAKCYATAVETFEQLVDELASYCVIETPQDLSQRTYYSLYRRPPAACTINWTNDAAHIEALVRGLTFGPYPNRLGLPKFYMGEQLYLATQLHQLPNPSQIEPGTIKAITADQLVITTGSYDVALQQIHHLNGEPVQLTDMALTVNDRLPGLTTSQIEQLSSLYQKICRHERFWVNRLTGLQPLTLPFNPPTNSSVHDALMTETQTLPAMGQHSEALLPALIIYFARLTGVYQFDIGFSYPDLKQTIAEFEPYFSPYVPLQITIDADDSYDVAQQAVEQQIETIQQKLTYAHDVMPRYPSLKEKANLQHGLPIVIEQIDSPEQFIPSPQAVLTVGLTPEGTVTWAYNPRRVAESDLISLTTHFETFLHGIKGEENSEQSVWQFPLLTEVELHHLLVDLNDSQADYPHDVCLHQLFEQQVEQHPQLIAVVYENDKITYGQLNHKANQLAHYLQTQGVTRDTPVGIFAERSIDMIVGMLGVLKAGGAYLPLDPNYPLERLIFMVEDACIPVMLTQADLLPLLSTLQCPQFCLDQDWDTIAQSPTDNPISSVTVDDLAYIIYTSGSTGVPKGVQLEHHGVVNLISWHQRAFNVTHADQAAQLAGLSFDAAVWEIWPYLTAGATLHLPPDEETRVSPEHLQAWLLTNQITLTFVPTPLAEKLMQLDWPDQVPLRAILTGGDKLHGYPPKTLPFALINNYGPTEYTVVTTSTTVPATPQDDRSPSIGYPISNTQIYILDAKLQPVPLGATGELHVGGKGLARGYLNRPELTAEKFIPNPFSQDPDARLYKTGDLARYLPDGSLMFIGRIDHQVKLRGFRVELGEIEAILHQHKAVKECVVIIREDTPGNKRLVAYLVAQDGQQKSQLLSEIRTKLQDKLPDYMIPAAFVFLETLPLTPNDKLDRQALPPPQTTDYFLTTTYIEPTTPTEKSVAVMVGDILGIERVGRAHNFFELGGHSLLATRLASRLQEHFQTTIPLRTVFEQPTVAELAEYIDTIQWSTGQIIQETEDTFEEGVL